MSILASFCDCPGKHYADCSLGKRLKIKYHSSIQKVWDIAGAKEAESLVDTVMEVIEQNSHAR